jgi:hypothetical protein
MANNLNLSLPSICRMGPQKPVGHTIQANPNGAFKFEIDQRRSMVLDKLHILLNGDLRDRQQGNVGESIYHKYPNLSLIAYRIKTNKGGLLIW